jgi:hypothetical protein
MEIETEETTDVEQVETTLSDAAQTKAISEEVSRLIFDKVNAADDEMTLPERIKFVDDMIVNRSNDARFRIARAVRNLLGQAKQATLSPAEIKSSAQAIGPLSEVLRNAGALLSSLHEVAQSEVWLSKDVVDVVRDLTTLLGACGDTEALRRVESNTITDVVKSLDTAAQCVEKSREVMDLVTDLATIELGVNNLGISRSDFNTLAGVNKDKD